MLCVVAQATACCLQGQQVTAVLNRQGQSCLKLGGAALQPTPTGFEALPEREC